MSVLRIILCVVGALVVHTAIVLFGGIFFLDAESHAVHQDVELLTEEVEKDSDETKLEEEIPDPMKTESEQPPDPNQVIASVENPMQDTNDAPALDAASLSAIEQLLNGGGDAAGGGFDGGTSLASGGRIGGTGRVGADEEEFGGAFSMSEIDQRPRATHQVAGAYPAALRSKKVEGVVTLIFIVDETGRVVQPRIEKSSHPEFDAPALEAVRQWKFEPAIKGGRRVSCRMRVPIRFQAR